MSHNKKKGGRSLTKLALFEERDKIHPRNETYEGLENFNGLVHKRSKTDLCFLIIYILCNLVVAVLFYLAYSTHDFSRLGQGWDFRGDVCGKVGTTVEERPFLYYEDPQKFGDTGMCVQSCPTVANIDMCFYDVDGKSLLDDYCYSSYPSIPIGRFCFPTSMEFPNRTLIQQYAKTPSIILRTIAGDLYKVWDIFFVALVITLFLGLVFLIGFLCDLTRKATLWACLLGCGALGAALVALFFMDYRKIVSKECENGVDENDCTGSKRYLLIVFAALTILAVIGFYVYICKNRDKIRFVLKRSSSDVLLRPIRQILTMILFLIILFIFQFGIVAFFLFGYIILMSSGQLTLILGKTKLNFFGEASEFPNYQYFEIRQASYMYFALVFYILMCLWNLGNTLIFGRMIITSAVSTWYFSKEKSILDLPIFRGVKFTLRYHIGTIAYGSICVALNWPFKSFVGIIKNRLKKIRNRKSRTFKFWMSTCNWPLTFYELVLKYVSNKNFMQTAIFGEEFCVAGVRVFYLKYRNESRLKLLKNTIGYYLILGKIFISLAVTIIAYALLLFNSTSPSGNDLTYLQFAYVPALIIFVVTLFTSQTFTSIFDLVIDTIFFCFICDEEMYAGRQRYAEKELREFMDQYGKEARKQDDDLDVRARPKQFKGEDENSLIEDNVFVTEQHKVSPTKDADIKKAGDDKHEENHEDETHQAYKVLAVDDAVSAISEHADHGVSVSDLHAKWLPPKADKDDDFGYKVVDHNAYGKKQDDEDDEEENESEEEGDDGDTNRVEHGFEIKEIGNARNTNGRNRRGKGKGGNNGEDDDEDEEEEDDEGDEDDEEEGEGQKSKRSRRQKEANDDDDDEDEEDLEQEQDDDGGKNRKFKKNNPNKNVSSKIASQINASSRLDSLYKMKTLNAKKNGSKPEDKKNLFF